MGPLPETARKVNAILVVVDRLSKMAHFLPCRTDITAASVAGLFVNRIFSLHGLPKSIVTDRGSTFVSEWTAEVLKRVGTRHCVSSAHHPESDGQTERVNRVLGEMLRHYVNKRYDDRDLQLPLAEFAHNNAHSSAIDSTPFFACYGKHPRTPMTAATDRQDQLGADYPMGKGPLRNDLLGVSEFVRDRQAVVRHCQPAMEAARQRMKAQVDSRRRDLSFKVGDLVSLRTKHLGTTTLPTQKLLPKYIGPFRVQKVVNPVAYKLEIPKSWRAFNVFHVSLLRPFKDNGEAVEPMSFTLIGGKDNEFEVEKVLDFRPKTLKANGAPRKVRELEFLIKWQGLPLGADDWNKFSCFNGGCNDALMELAGRFKLPDDVFLKGGNTLPAPWVEPALPTPPANE